ncbi:hypothetical protein G3N56_03950 [Desulfovibrio sulfodismutans]|uniref:Uncharacterized protein n=1 Tax=Desulfolutivibrio sulfodismutans TaxID=63561 RepID=A0A7K3NJE5_9BACT|nr:hypothetical protein [Desulfolutivibrio sulfodismutans]NDY55895.1 hypothetical protein [Desulfolutivibrio sulfodismutans]
MIDAFAPYPGDTSESLPDWPDWLHDQAIGDEAFAAAHDALSAPERARIKQTLARMFAAHDPGGALVRSVTVGFEPDGLALTRLCPRPYAVVAIGPDLVSPSRLLAACLPALLARTPLVAVVRVETETPWPTALLAALELCGVESAFSLSAKNAARLFSELHAAHPRGLVVDFGPAARMSPRPPFLSVAPSGRLGVWRTSARSFDLEALAFAQAGSQVTVWGRAGGLPEGMQTGEGDFADFLAQGYEAAFVPRGKMEAALCAAPGPDLVLGPGMECFWAFPQAPVAAFVSGRTAYAARPQHPGSGI